MTDETTANVETSPVCPWCSAALPDPAAVTCPSCGAALKGSVDESLPGLTAIDAGAIVRAKQTAIRPKSRLMSWLTGGDDDDLFTKAEGNALEPPDLAVKREIFRLELEAEVANLQAENEAIMAEAVAEGRVVEVPPELAEAVEAAGIDLPAMPEVDAAATAEAAPSTEAADESAETTTPVEAAESDKRA
jgi:hypothetical protein